MEHKSKKEIHCPMCDKKHMRTKEAKKMEKVMAGMDEHRQGMSKHE